MKRWKTHIYRLCFWSLKFSIFCFLQILSWNWVFWFLALLHFVFYCEEQLLLAKSLCQMNSSLIDMTLSLHGYNEGFTCCMFVLMYVVVQNSRFIFSNLGTSELDCGLVLVSIFHFQIILKTMFFCGYTSKENIDYVLCSCIGNAYGQI